MQYKPDFLNPRPIFTAQEQRHLAALSAELPLSVLLQSPRNMEEIGIDFVHSSAELEGNAYDKHDTLVLLKMGQTAGGKLFSDAVMLLNLRASYEYMLSCLDANQPEQWKTFIKNTHALIAKDLLPNYELGTVRQGSVQISGTDYTPLVNPQKLDAELNYLIGIAEKIANPFDKALYFHNNLAYLQFFRDCNKRTARNTLSFSLMQADIFPCVFVLDSYKAYSDGILAYYETGEFALSREYFIHAYEQTVQKYAPKPDPEFTRDI